MSPSRFSLASSRAGSVPPGTPVNAVLQHNALLDSLEQGEPDDGPDDENQDPPEFNSVDSSRSTNTSSAGAVSWANTCMKCVE